jgi:hypothetical protein
VIQVDNRIASDPRNILLSLGEEVKPLVRVPDELMKCVVFLGYKKHGIFSAHGTGFYLYKLGAKDWSFLYLVTAKHVIDGIRTKGDGRVVIRYNTKEGKASYCYTDISQWFYHQDDYEVDIAVASIAIPDDSDHRTFPVAGIVTSHTMEKEGIGVGDEVFLSGLFEHHQEETRNFPIIRVGNIAGLPKEKFPLKHFGPADVYFIEARSIGGLSGSPVFIQPDVPRFRNEDEDPGYSGGRHRSYLYQRPFYLLGVAHGHVGEKTQDRVLNVGIAIVIPGIKILEALNQEKVIEGEQQFKKRWQDEQISAIEDSGNPSI